MATKTSLILNPTCLIHWYGNALQLHVRVCVDFCSLYGCGSDKLQRKNTERWENSPYYIWRYTTLYGTNYTHRKEEVELFLPGSAWQLWQLFQTPPWHPPCSWQSTRDRQRRWSTPPLPFPLLSSCTSSCFSSLIVLGSLRMSLLLPTRITGALGRKSFTSGEHFSEIFSNDSGESTEKHMRITSIVICPWIGSREVKNVCVFGPFC